MKRMLSFLTLSLLIGCTTHPNEGPALPQGNMPMTEHEYRDYQSQMLRECQRDVEANPCH